MTSHKHDANFIFGKPAVGLFVMIDEDDFNESCELNLLNSEIRHIFYLCSGQVSFNSFLLLGDPRCKWWRKNISDQVSVSASFKDHQLVNLNTQFVLKK
jgi:hypothetical protein